MHYEHGRAARGDEPEGSLFGVDDSADRRGKGFVLDNLP